MEVVKALNSLGWTKVLTLLKEEALKRSHEEHYSVWALEWKIIAAHLAAAQTLTRDNNDH